MTAGTPQEDVAVVRWALNVQNTTHATDAVAALDRLEQRIARLTYPATPVDCLISELRDLFFPVLSKTSVMTMEDFEKRVAQFKEEVAAEPEERAAWREGDADDGRCECAEQAEGMR